MSLKNAALVGLLAAALALATAIFGFCPERERPRAGPAPVLTPERAVPAATSLAPAAASLVVATPAPAPAEEDPIEEEVLVLARELDLDAATRSRVADLTRRSFYSLVDEVRALHETSPESASSEAVDGVIEKRTKELHGRIEALLDPARAARYRALIGR